MRTFPAITLALLVGCSTTSSDRTAAPSAPPEFELEDCTQPTQKTCIVRATPYLADDPDAEHHARQRKEGVRFLELWDENVRKHICDAEHPKDQSSCRDHLAALNEYLNPGGERPPRDAISVALEGGGSKSAPFTLGVLAGLHEAGLFKQGRIGAISSVSGGSYAASFLFNRLWDYHSHQPSVTEVPEACREAPPPTGKASLRADAGKPGTYDDWFRSCVPDPYTADGAPLDGLRGGLPQCGEVRGRGHKSFNEFHDEYRYQGHVWRFPDLLFGDGMAMLKTDRVARFPEAAQTAGLTVASAGTFPLQLVSRTLFRWPINTAPTKNVYRYGIERQFGFSPEDWQEAQKLGAKMTEVSAQRRRERTLACLGTLLNGKAAPTWILNSSTPGPITVLDWVTTPERNPSTLR